MKHYQWENVREEAMPAQGSVLRRFVNGERMTVARVAFTAGSVAPEHRHPNEQFSVVLSGTMEFVIEGEPLVVRAGEMVHLEANVFHGAKALEDAVLLDVFAPLREDWGTPPV